MSCWRLSTVYCLYKNKWQYNNSLITWAGIKRFSGSCDFLATWQWCCVNETVPQWHIENITLFTAWLAVGWQRLYTVLHTDVWLITSLASQPVCVFTYRQCTLTLPGYNVSYCKSSMVGTCQVLVLWYSGQWADCKWTVILTNECILTSMNWCQHLQ